jgi:hypothetical protein
MPPARPTTPAIAENPMGLMGSGSGVTLNRSFYRGLCETDLLSSGAWASGCVFGPHDRYWGFYCTESGLVAAPIVPSAFPQDGGDNHTGHALLAVSAVREIHATFLVTLMQAQKHGRIICFTLA